MPKAKSIKVLITGSRGFIGKNKGEFAEIKTPSGDKNFEITDVKYI